jgi:hypothetical protein
MVNKELRTYVYRWSSGRHHPPFLDITTCCSHVMALFRLAMDTKAPWE